MKALEAYCMAVRWQGGTIEQVRSDVRVRCPNIDSDPYRWGYREGKSMRYGKDLSQYPIPINSWDRSENIEFVPHYIKGILDGMESVG